MTEKKEVKSFKVLPELKSKLEKLFEESGLETQEQWLEQAVALWEMQLLKDGLPGHRKSLDELEYHSKRTIEIYMSMLNTEAADRLKLSQEYEDKLNNRANEIFQQQTELEELRATMHQLNALLTQSQKDKIEIEKQLHQAQEISRKNDLLVDEYRSKNDTLAGLLNESKDTVEKSKQHLSRINSLETEVKTQAEAIKQLTLAAENTNISHNNEINRLLETKEIDKERELLKLKAEYQDKIASINDSTTSKIRELYEELDKTRKSHDIEISALTKEISALTKKTAEKEDN